jgi:hypothetical protein
MFYHGTSDAVFKGHKLLPPSETGVISEQGRKKNLDKVFFTSDYGLAKIYAGRAINVFGGSPVVLRVIPMDDVETINSTKGASVYCTSWAFVEERRGQDA